MGRWLTGLTVLSILLSVCLSQSNFFSNILLKISVSTHELLCHDHESTFPISVTSADIEYMNDSYTIFSEGVGGDYIKLIVADAFSISNDLE